MTDHNSHHFHNQDYNRTYDSFKLQRKSISFINGQAVVQYHQWNDPEFEKKSIVWLRPDEICRRQSIDSPKFTVGGVSRFDVNQGALGNCWFMASQQALAEHAERMQNMELLQKVILPYHDFDDEGYAEIFCFRFWTDKGGWTEVVIDDLLPTIDVNGVFQGLQYCQNHTQRNEFWAPLLEKAYAKWHGGYHKLDGGREKDALKELTGGKVFNYRGKPQVKGYVGDEGSLAKNPDVPSRLFDIVNEAYVASALMTCAIYYKRDDKMEKQLPSGHAYTITKVAHIPWGPWPHAAKKRLIRIRNPHGDKGVEWQGKWSDKSKEMIDLGAKKRDELGLVIDHDGEFWMSFRDFCDNFDDLTICKGPFPRV